MYSKENLRKLNMTITETIKNSIRNALYNKDNNIIFHFEEIKHTGFPYAILTIKDFTIEPNLSQMKQLCDFNFELVYMKSPSNKTTELLDSVDFLKSALLPVIEIEGKKITVDTPRFSIKDDKLLMTFKLSFYIYEEDAGENMQILDITLKENKNA